MHTNSSYSLSEHSVDLPFPVLHSRASKQETKIWTMAFIVTLLLFYSLMSELACIVSQWYRTSLLLMEFVLACVKIAWACLSLLAQIEDAQTCKSHCGSAVFIMLKLG